VSQRLGIKRPTADVSAYDGEKFSRYLLSRYIGNFGLNFRFSEALRTSIFTSLTSRIRKHATTDV
jgi:hypothetical protein